MFCEDKRCALETMYVEWWENVNDVEDRERWVKVWNKNNVLRTYDEINNKKRWNKRKMNTTKKRWNQQQKKDEIKKMKLKRWN